MSSSTAVSDVCEVKCDSYKELPSLTPGKLSPAVYHEWVIKCSQYFETKKVLDDRMIFVAMSGVRDPIMKDWYYSDQLALHRLSWIDFCDRFQARFLEKYWDQKVVQGMSRLSQTSEEPPTRYIERLERQNILLRGSTLRWDDERLREHIESHSVADVRAEANKLIYRAVTDFRVWKAAICEYDEDRLRTRARTMREVKSVLALERQQTNARRPTSNRDNRETSISASASTSAAKPRLPSLTSAEREYLMANSGCLKCRKANVDHRSNNCPNGFPDAVGYKSVGPIGKSVTVSTSTVAKRSTVGAVNASEVTTSTLPDDDDIDLDHIVAAIADTEIDHIVTSGVLDAGSYSSSSEEDDEYVPPLTVKQLLWQAHIRSNSGLSDRMPMLIDCGSSPVLIRSDVVEANNLRRQSLAKPFPLSDAFSGCQEFATEFVRLQVAAADSSYTACAVRALVVDSLCVPVLLGNPFLKRNDLLVDIPRRAVWEATTGVDILAPGPSSSPPLLPPIERRRQRMEYEQLQTCLRMTQHKDVLRELKQSISRQEGEPLLGVPALTVAAIRSRIEDIAELDAMRSADAAMKHEFRDRFPSDIPHIHDLPTDVYHEFSTLR